MIASPRLRRLRHAARWLRAFARDTRALWSEFSRPVLAFVIALFGGGWLYGELWAWSRGERLPFSELPYTMLLLMALQGAPEEKPPTEIYLVVFWYLMPVIGFYVVGRGAVDFVRVFFNREQRRQDWERALAMEYRDHIIVVGIGNVGLRVIRALRGMNFDVVAIDNHPPQERWDELKKIGVPLVTGDAALPVTLEGAGVAHAQSVVVCTSNDFTNLTVTMRVRDLNNRVRIVCRMWDYQFAEQLRKYFNVETVLSASELAAPAFAGAAFGVDIAQTLSVRGEAYSLCRLTVKAGSFLDGSTVRALQDEWDMDIVLVERRGAVDLHPRGDLVVRAGDGMVLFAHHEQIIRIAAGNMGRG